MFVSPPSEAIEILAEFRIADIDREITEHERAQITKVLAAELPKDYKTKLHESIPEPSTTRFSDLIQKEIDRKADGLPLEGGIDTSRYETIEPPSPIDPGVHKDQAQAQDPWRATLRQAYVSSTYLQSRLINLALLEEFGKNAWLVGNAQLEDVLRDLEMELASTQEQTDAVNKSRKGAQESVRGEMEGLDQAWQKGIGRVIEVEVAAEEMRQQILKQRRAMSQKT
ncbi:MAG: hypothetical protein M1824_000787 [Vezdaea acicularis]|nr:MAG: hypothetical protein M1824_000787 [Vezdaea acicularis]